MKIKTALWLILFSMFFIFSQSNTIFAQPQNKPLRGQFMEQLTEDQRQQISETVQQMHGERATRQEIRDAVHRLLDKFGINLPDNPEQQPNMPDPNGQSEARRKFDSKNFPNPFNPETQISYILENPEYVSLKIYNMQG